MIRVGTSGWSYPEWRGTLYPKGTGAAKYLKIYADNFDTVEINNSFYRFPRGEMFAPWYERTPHGFLFAAKLWRGLVHGKEVRERWVRDFFQAVDVLKDKLGPVIIQLPPNRPSSHEWLDDLLSALPKKHRYAVELRDRRWLNDDVYAVLEKHNAANCYYDFKGFRNLETPTSDWLYIRLHGPTAQPYVGGYSPQRLTHYATLMKRHRGDSYIYFDNTASGHAVDDARTLIKYVGNAAPSKAA